MARRATTQRDAALTVLTLVLVAGFLAMGYWQLTRALSGNSLSWAYVFEWPLFAGYLLYIRWRLTHDPRLGAAAGHAVAPGVEPHNTLGADQAQHVVDEEDEELAAYNRYLAALQQSGRRKRW